jgi:hypothetical protein
MQRNSSKRLRNSTCATSRSCVASATGSTGSTRSRWTSRRSPAARTCRPLHRAGRYAAQHLPAPRDARDGGDAGVRCETLHWITVGPTDQPGTSIVLYPPGAAPGITDYERRTIVEMMAKGTYASHQPGHHRPRGDLRAAAGRRRRRRPAADRAAVRGSRLRRPRSRGQPDPHPGAPLNRPAIASRSTPCSGTWLS